MSTALILGSEGFVGRYMTRALHERGFETVGIDIANGVDARDFFRVNDSRYDLVVHLAADAPHRVGIDSVNTSFLQNIQLDSMMFEWVIKTSPRAVMYFSSSAAYPAFLQDGSTTQPLREDALDLFSGDYEFPTRPFDNYGWSKQNGERMARTAADHGIRVHILRPFSGYGEDQHLNFPFAAIIQRAKVRDLKVWGPIGQRRDFIHITDLCEGALRVYENDERRPVNLCTGVATEMGDLMKLASIEYQKRCRVDPSSPLINYKVNYDESKPTGVFYRVGDPTRMHEHYTAKISLEEGVQRALRG